MSIDTLSLLARIVLILWAVVFIVAVVAYVASRAASFGWHKSKLEHMKHLLKLTNEEHENGK